MYPQLSTTLHNLARLSTLHNVLCTERGRVLERQAMFNPNWYYVEDVVVHVFIIYHLIRTLFIQPRR